MEPNIITLISFIVALLGFGFAASFFAMDRIEMSLTGNASSLDLSRSWKLSLALGFVCAIVGVIAGVTTAAS